MADPAEIAETDDDGKRERSTIEFPYMDLDDAVEVANAIHRTTGSGVCAPDQLAAALDLSMNSSGFRSRISTAKMFGLVSSDRGGNGAHLTPLGLDIINPEKLRRAKVEAFLKVPLYKALFDRKRGQVLPPAAALEREMAQIGVSSKQTDRARQTFERSAQSAGFFDAGRDKLVMPAFASTPPLEKEGETGGGGGGGGAGGGGSRSTQRGHLDVVVEALIQKLPPGDQPFPVDARIRWLRQIEMAFQDAYGEGEAEIEIKKGTSSTA